MNRILLLTLGLFSIICVGQTNDLNLMPIPKEFIKGESRLKIKTNFTIGVDGVVSNRVELATTKFLRRLSDKTGVFIDQGFALNNVDINKVTLFIEFERLGELVLNEDESYKLEVASDKIKINAVTDIGVVYALETLYQLVANNSEYYYFPEVKIGDGPRFPWRGLMIDVARHFMPVDVIKRNLDAMAFVKMNVFHWHLVDDQGFRIESKTHPKLHELASDGQYYTQEQIKDIVKYASDRAIRVVPEIDVPAHATAFVTAYPEIASKDTVYTLQRFAGQFDPTLDPTNERTYEILTDLFGEVSKLFPDKYFHIGGDENEGKQWDENENIQKFMKENDLKDNHELQTYFNIRLEKILLGLNKSMMGWEEIMTEHMPTTALIHSWRGVNEGIVAGQSIVNAAKNGYMTIQSNGYYIDLLQPAQEHYIVDPIPDHFTMTKMERERILGGESTMWSELVTPLTIDSRIWPRTAAIAERFWSPKEINDVDDMYRRLDPISNSLEQIGLTHLKNKRAILNNIANYQSIDALENLTKITEPYKIYSRNAGGTQYKSFSPFTLFADACTADASDAYKFNKLVHEYISKPTEDKKSDLLIYLKSWSVIDDDLMEISRDAPLVLRVLPFASRVSKISDLFIAGMEKEKFSKSEFKAIEKLLNEKEDPEINLDVELAVSSSLLDLAVFLNR